MKSKMVIILLCLRSCCMLRRQPPPLRPHHLCCGRPSSSGCIRRRLPVGYRPSYRLSLGRCHHPPQTGSRREHPPAQHRVSYVKYNSPSRKGRRVGNQGFTLYSRTKLRMGQRPGHLLEIRTIWWRTRTPRTGQIGQIPTSLSRSFSIDISFICMICGI